MGKFTLCCVIALMAIQTYSGASASINLTPTTRGILDFFNELKEQLNKIIQLALQLPTSISDLQDRLNEIIANINISAVMSQLNSEVSDIIDQGGSNAEKCRDAANQKLQELSASSEAAGKACLDATESRIEAIQDKINAVVDEAKSLLIEVNKKILNCVLENPLNPTRCLQGSYEQFKQQVAALQTKASAVVEETTNDAENIVQDFSKCMTEVQTTLISNGQKIIKETEECVKLAA